MAALLLAGLALSTPPPVHARPAVTACDGVPVDVTSDSTADAAIACEGARDAFAFLRPLALETPPRVPVDIVERLPPDLRADAVGCYQSVTRRVSVLTSRAFLARRSWFGVPTSPILYRSIVAHEVAHALVGCHLGGRPLPTAALEYVAYVTMFATMDPATRERALAAMPVRGYERDSQFNDFTYAFDPMGFGVGAYRHWRQQADGMAFLRRVIAGDVVPDLGGLN